MKKPILAQRIEISFEALCKGMHSCERTPPAPNGNFPGCNSALWRGRFAVVTPFGFSRPEPTKLER
jgi:hypothetical protein